MSSQVTVSSTILRLYLAIVLQVGWQQRWPKFIQVSDSLWRSLHNLGLLFAFGLSDQIA